MPAAQVALATITLGSSASSVTFGSIPATYRDLRLIIDATLSSADTAKTVYIRANGDTGTNYSYVYAYGSGSAAESGSGTLSFFSQGAVGASRGVNTIDYLDYSATDKHKTALVRMNMAGVQLEMAAERWASTAAINSLTISLGVGLTYAAGSVFSLYGIVS